MKENREQAELFSFMAHTSNTLTEVKARLKAHDDELKSIKDRLERIEAGISGEVIYNK